jgi:filamentous hemagglutinin family protein
MMGFGPYPLRLLLASCTALTALAPGTTSANPEGGRVVAGQASISTPSANHTVVRQGSARAVIDWRSFSIGKGEHTQFVQPSASSVALNRVTGPDPSVIAGRLSANGRIVLQNESGVTFSEGAQVNAASMLATTSRIDAERLMATGDVVANLPGRVAGARVENRGEITVADSGVAALVGPEVRNSGRIVARQGRVVLGGAETYTIDLAGDGLVAFEIRDPVSRAPSDGGAVVEHTGTIEAPGGQVIVSARAARGVVDDVIFVGGRVAATTVRQEGGTIVLDGGEAGTVRVAGNLDASGRGAGERGGTVDLRGERVALAASARIDASGRAGGGTVRVGGDLQGKGPRPNARHVTVDRGAEILADATEAGQGGTAIVWSDETTRFWGRISARGGPAGGDGGFAEVSSKGWLDFRGLADLRATLGRTGVLLLDPTDIRIAAAASSANLDIGATIQVNAAGTPTSTLNVTDLQTQLGLADVIVTTVGSPNSGGTGLITIDTSIVIPDPAGPTTRTLTLLAQGGIVQSAGTSITVAGGGSATLVMQSGQGTGGTGGITLAGTIALGAAGLLDLDATGGAAGAGGAISQTAGSISAAQLRARASGGVSLISAGAGTVAGSAGGAFSLTGTTAFAVGTVAGTTGITTTNQPITLSAPGTLTLDEAVNAGTGTVSLTAGADAFLTVNEAVTAGAVTVVADRIAVNEALGGAGAASVDIATATAARPILIGTGAQLGNPGADTTALAVTQGEFGRLGAGNAAVRLRTTTGTVTVTGSGIDLGARRLFLSTGNTGATAISQTGPVTGGIGSALAVSASVGSVVLTNTGNDVPVLAGRAGALPGNSFRYTSAGDVTVGSAQGSGAIPSLAGIVTTGAPVTLVSAGAMTLNQAVTVAGGTVALTTTGADGITQSGTGVITANRLEVDASAGAQLASALNQVATLAAETVGGLSFHSAQSLDASVLNTGSGAVGITAPNIEVVNDGALGLTGVRNDAGATALVAETGTVTVTEPVSATTTATLNGDQVTVNDTVTAPTVVAAADSLAIDPILGALGTATLTRAVLRTSTAGREIRIGDIQPGDEIGALAIGPAEIARIGVGAGLYELRIGSLGGTARSGEVATGTLTVRGTGADFTGRALTLEAGSAGAVVTQDANAALLAGSLLVRTAQGSVLLAEAANTVGALAGSAGGASSDFEFATLGTLLLDSLTHDAGAAVPGVTAGRTVRLEAVFDFGTFAPGDIRQTSAGRISAQSLVARSILIGEVDLSTASTNDVGVIAGTAVNGFRYRDANTLTIGVDATTATSGVSVSNGAPISLLAGTDLALEAPVDAGAAGIVRLQAGQDLTQIAGGTVTSGSLLARAGRDVLLDGANGTELPGVPGGTGGNAAGTVAAVAGRELWYRSAQGFSVGSVAGDGLVAGASGATGGAGGVVRLASAPGTGITVNEAIAGAGVEFAADLVGINATVGAAADLVVLRPISLGQFITLGIGSLDAAAIDLIGGATTTLRIGSAGSATEAASGGITVFGPIRVNRLGQAGDARTLVLETGLGSISQFAPITGGAAATLVASAQGGEVLLGNAGNDVGTIAGTATLGGFRYRDSNAVEVGQTTTVSVGTGQALTALGRDGVSTPSLAITLMAGGNLGILRPVDAGGQTIRLQAGGALSQAAAGTLDAGALLAHGGSVDLTGTGNQIGILAGSASTSGGFRVRHSGNLVVGTVGGDAALPVAGQAGLFSNAINAPVTLRVDGGDLTLASAVSTGFAAGSFVRFQASGAITQGAGGTISTQGLLARAGTGVTLEASNTVGTLAGEAASLFRFANTTDLTVGQFAADGTLVATADGVSLGAGTGTMNLTAGSFGFGSLVLDRPVDAGTGSLALVAGAFGGNIQQTATGGITSGSLGVTASAGGVDLASAGAANTVPTLTGTGRDGFRFRAAGALTVGAGGIGTTNAPLTLVSNGTLGLAGSLAAGVGTVRLRSLTGSINQTGGAITAAALAAHAENGNIDLQSPGNALGTFAAITNGPLAFSVAGALTIGPVGPDGPAESQVGVVVPGAVLVPGLAGAVSTTASVNVGAGTVLTVDGTVDAATSATLTAGVNLFVNALVEAGTNATLTATSNLIVTGTVDAGGAATLTAGLGIGLLPGASVLAGGAATLDAGGAIALSLGSTVETRGTATLDAGAAIDVSGTVDAGTDAVLVAGQGMTVSGSVLAGDDASLDATTTLVVSGLVNATGDALLTSGQAMTVGGSVIAGAVATLDSGAALDVQLGGLLQSGTTGTLTAVGAVTVGGTIDVGTDATLTAGQAITVAGSVTAGGTATLGAGTGIDVSGTVDAGIDAGLTAGAALVVSGTVLADGDATLDTTSTLSVVGVLDATGAVTLNAGQAMSVAGSVIAGDAATLSAGQAMTVSGSVTAGDALTLNAGAIDVGPMGTIRSGADAALTSGSSLIIDGQLEAAGNATLDASGLFEISGTIDVAGSATLDAQGPLAALNVLTGGSVRAGGTATLRGSEGISIVGTVDAGQDATLTAALRLNVFGSVSANRAVTLQTTGELTVAGLVSAGTTANLVTTGDMRVLSSGSVLAGGNTTFSSRSFSSNGQIQIGGNVDLNSVDFVTVGGNLIAAGDATLDSGSNIIVFGLLDAGVAAVLTAGGSIAIDFGDTLRAGGAATLTAGQHILVQGSVFADSATLHAGATLSIGDPFLMFGGVVQTNGDMMLSAVGGLTTEINSLVRAGGNATLTTSSAVTINGTVDAGADATLRSLTGAVSIATGGVVDAGGAATLSAAQSLSVAGSLRAGTATTLDAAGALSVDGLVDTGTDATLTAGQGLMIAGTVDAGGSAALTSGQAMTVANTGLVRAGADAALATPAAVTVDGTIDAGAAATLTAGQGMTVAGLVRAGDAATLQANAALSVAGTVEAGADAALRSLAGALTIAASGVVDAGLAATLEAAGPITIDGTLAAGTDLAMTAGQGISVTGTAAAGASASVDAGGAITVPGSLTAGVDATLEAGGTITADGTVRAGRDARLLAQQSMTVAGSSVIAGRDARLETGGTLTVTGTVNAGRDAILRAIGDLTISGLVLAGADALLGTAGDMIISGRVRAGQGGFAILGFGGDFTLEGELGAPDGRIMIRRAEQGPASLGLIKLDGDNTQFSLGGAPEMIVIDSTGDLRLINTPDPGTDVGQLRTLLEALVLQTPDQIAANRIVRLAGFPSFTSTVTGVQTEFGRLGAGDPQSNVEIDLGSINAPGTLLYVFGEDGDVTSAEGFQDALTLRAVGIYVNDIAEVSIFGVINGVAGDNASTFVQRLGDPQFRQLINQCAIATLGCTFLPLAQEPAIYVPPVVVLEGGPPRLDESSVPIVNTGPEDTLRTAASESGEEDEEDEQRAEAPEEGWQPAGTPASGGGG